MRRIRQAVDRQIGRKAPDDMLFSRRRLLMVSGLALGGVLAGRKLRAQPLLKAVAPRIAIVGAGIGGLVAALSLQDAGVPFALYEASGRIGGRMHSNNRFWGEGQTSEWCGEFIDSTHHTLRSLAARFGLQLVDVNAADPASSQDTNYFQGGYYSDAELAADMHVVAPILHDQNKAIGALVSYNHFTDAGFHFDNLSSYEWIESYVPGGHDSRLGRYLDVATTTENGLDTTQQSSLNLILPLHTDERFHIQNGNQQLPLAIAAALAQGCIHSSWRLTAIAADGNGSSPVTLTFDTPEGVRIEKFDFAILALPFSVLRGLDIHEAGFDPLKRQAIEQLGYGTNSKLVLQFDSRYWNGRGAWPGIGDGFVETDLEFQSTWDSSRAEAGRYGLLTNYTGGTSGAVLRPRAPYTTSRASGLTAGYAQQFLDQLEIVWPGVGDHYSGLATLSYPSGDPNLLGSYSTYKVGQYTQFGDYEGVPQGRVFFAGEHTSYNFQGFMEGGARSGQRAAQEVLAVLA